MFTDHTSELSGGERSLLALLGDREFDATVVLATDGPLASELQNRGFDVHILQLSEAARTRSRLASSVWGGASSLLTIIAYGVRLRKIVKREQPDVVVANSLKALIYSVIAGGITRTPVVWLARDYIHSSYLPRHLVILVRFIARWLIGGVISNSRAVSRTLPGAEERICYPSVERLELSQRNARADGPVRVVSSVGRLAAWKGQKEALAVYLNLKRADPPVTFWLVGSALFQSDIVYQEELLAQIRASQSETRNIKVFGQVDNVLQIMTSTDILLHLPASPEPFGRVLVEAMSQGVIVVTYGVGGPAEIIEDGVNGLLVPPGDLEAAREAVERCIDDPALRRRLSTSAIDRAQLFHPENCRRVFQKHLDSILA